MYYLNEMKLKTTSTNFRSQTTVLHAGSSITIVPLVTLTSYYLKFLGLHRAKNA
jgi:hypothetical protein